LQSRVGFRGLERPRVRQRSHRLPVYGSKHRGIVGGIRIGFADHLDDADDLLLVAGVVEERVVAEPHRLEMRAGAKVAHSGPRLALAAALDLVVPGECLRLGFEQPIRHHYLLILSPSMGTALLMPPPETAGSRATRSPRRYRTGRPAPPRRHLQSASRRRVRAPSRRAPMP